MKVKELVQILSEMNQELEIVSRADKYSSPRPVVQVSVGEYKEIYTYFIEDSEDINAVVITSGR